MDVFVTILIIIGCLGLILFVLVQNPKGGGLNTEFGSAGQLGGARRATDILEKGTWGLAVGVAVLCLFMSINSGRVAGDDIEEFDANADQINQIDDNTGGNAGGNSGGNGFAPQ